MNQYCDKAKQGSASTVDDEYNSLNTLQLLKTLTLHLQNTTTVSVI